MHLFGNAPEKNCNRQASLRPQNSATRKLDIWKHQQELTSQLTHKSSVFISRGPLQLLRLKCMHNQVGRYVSCHAVIISMIHKRSHDNCLQDLD